MKTTRRVPEADAEAQLEFARLGVQGAIIAGVPEEAVGRFLTVKDLALAVYLDAVREAGQDAAAALIAYAEEWDRAADDIRAHRGEVDGEK